MAEVGEDSAIVHMLLGKAMLNLEAYDDAAKELNAAAEADPETPVRPFQSRPALLQTGRLPNEHGKNLKKTSLLSRKWSSTTTNWATHDFSQATTRTQRRTIARR